VTVALSVPGPVYSVHPILPQSPRPRAALRSHDHVSKLTQPDRSPDCGDRPPDGSPVPGHAGASAEELFPLAYEELLRVASHHLGRERPGHTLDTASLVHEAYLKLAGRERTEWRDRSRFLAIASRAMRQILVDHARGRGRQKRGGGVWPVTLRTDAGSGREETVDLLALDGALRMLTEHDARLGQVVECRFFGGLTAEETAEALGVSLRTVERDWTRARAHLVVLLGA
jgi:RNA polymerase sigma factor (TIGR02999 family)